MKQEVAKAWADDLRSGPPKCQGTLFDGIGYCCLGRLCVVLGIEAIRKTDSSLAKENGCYYEFDGSIGSLPQSVMKASGVRTRYGSLFDSDSSLFDSDATATTCSLARMNDGGFTFTQIADFIDTHWKRL